MYVSICAYKCWCLWKPNSPELGFQVAVNHLMLVLDTGLRSLGRTSSALNQSLFPHVDFVFETEFFYVVLTVLKLLTRPSWPWTHREPSASLCFPSAGIKGMCHSTQYLFIYLFIYTAAIKVPIQYHPGLSSWPEPSLHPCFILWRWDTLIINNS